jgi:two-component system phosphate regulon response regulator PhoB
MNAAPSTADRILVVDDETEIVALVAYHLAKTGYRVSTASSGQDALELARRERPSLIVLDLMLPGMSGFDVLEQLRLDESMRDIAVIMLTARREEPDRIRGLSLGADDYLTKPFSMSELIARIRAVLRRIRPGLADDRLNHGDIVIDRVAHRVRRSGQEIHLGPTEFRLLDHLMQHPGRVFSREQLLDAVWGSDVYVEARTVDVHVGRLRKALNVEGTVNPIRTVRSAGYSLDLGG